MLAKLTDVTLDLVAHEILFQFRIQLILELQVLSTGFTKDLFKCGVKYILFNIFSCRTLFMVTVMFFM